MTDAIPAVLSDPFRATFGDNTVDVVAGQHHKFMLIPIMDHHADFVEAGLITFGIEGRALGDGKGNIGVRGVSIHVFNSDRSEEYARFDCFDKVPHYHYILQKEQHNIVWGYDPVINGPILPWSLNVIRERLPAIIRHAGATELADRLDREGWNRSAIEKVETLALAQEERTADAFDLAEEGYEWMVRWKEIHPQFNTVDY